MRGREILQGNKIKMNNLNNNHWYEIKKNWNFCLGHSFLVCVWIDQLIWINIILIRKFFGSFGDAKLSFKLTFSKQTLDHWNVSSFFYLKNLYDVIYEKNIKKITTSNFYFFFFLHFNIIKWSIYIYMNI